MANGTASPGGNSSPPETDSKTHVPDVSIGPGIMRHHDTQSKDLAASPSFLTSLGSSCPLPCAVHPPLSVSQGFILHFPSIGSSPWKACLQGAVPAPTPPSVHKEGEHLRRMLIKVIIQCRCAVPVLNYVSVQRQHFQRVRAGSTGVMHCWASRAVRGWRSCACSLFSGAAIPGGLLQEPGPAWQCFRLPRASAVD